MSEKDNKNTTNLEAKDIDKELEETLEKISVSQENNNTKSKHKDSKKESLFDTLDKSLKDDFGKPNTHFIYFFFIFMLGTIMILSSVVMHFNLKKTERHLMNNFNNQIELETTVAKNKLLFDNEISKLKKQNEVNYKILDAYMEDPTYLEYVKQKYLFSETQK